MPAFGSWEHDLSPEQVAAMIDSGEAEVIDVREPYEREAGYIEGTRHIELERVASQAESLPRDRPIVFYCRLGARSGMAARAFRASGWDAWNMAGGITLWDEQDLPLAPEGGTVADH